MIQCKSNSFKYRKCVSSRRDSVSRGQQGLPFTVWPVAKLRDYEIVEEASKKSTATLRASNSAFKSKEIADVRRSLEGLLREKRSEMKQICSKVPGK